MPLYPMPRHKDKQRKGHSKGKEGEIKKWINQRYGKRHIIIGPAQTADVSVRSGRGTFHVLYVKIACIFIMRTRAMIMRGGRNEVLDY